MSLGPALHLTAIVALLLALCLLLRRAWLWSIHPALRALLARRVKS